MRGGCGHERGLTKANRQLLLAAELTYDEDLAARLADLGHRVGRMADGDEEPSPEALATLGAELRTLGTDAHADVRDAIGRARRLLSNHERRVAP